MPEEHSSTPERLSREQLLSAPATLGERAITMRSEAELQRTVSLAAPRQQQDLSRIVLRALQYHFRPLPQRPVNVGLAATHAWPAGQGIRSHVPLAMVRRLCDAAKAAFAQDATLVRLQSPAYLFGDLHGNFHDLTHFSKLWGFGAAGCAANLVFCGDYVDRGAHSVEVALYLLALKLQAPKSVVILRGNHECADINCGYDLLGVLARCKQAYGGEYPSREDFDGDDEQYDEALQRDDGSEGYAVWRCINDVFDMLPLAAVVDSKIFCAHGGIPRATLTEKYNLLSTIESIPRPILAATIDRSHLILDLLWADPARAPKQMSALGRRVYKTKAFGPNDLRQPQTAYSWKTQDNSTAYGLACWGEAAVDLFLKYTGCTHVVRAHEQQSIGFSLRNKGRVITLFSSSHYLMKKDAEEGNRAACLLVKGDELTFLLTQFGAEHGDF